MSSKRSGCGTTVWWMLAIFIGVILFTDDDDLGGDPFGDAPVNADQVGGGNADNPRRPDPYGDQYIIAAPGPMKDSQGTGFVIDDNGIWLTAQHVTSGCDRLGMYDGVDLEPVSRVTESAVADAAVIRDGPTMPVALPLGADRQESGSVGWHMGFPAGETAIVETVLIGEAVAQRGMAAGARGEPVLAWAEVQRIGYGGGSLGGISGGPVLSAGGDVVGVVSASTDRRGRILSTAPAAIGSLLRQSVQIATPVDRRPLASAAAAQMAFRQWLAGGVIRQVYCDVR